MLVLIDGYTKFLEVEIMKSTQAHNVIKQLDKVFATHGFPDKITSDNGPPFNSHELKEYMNQCGIQHHRITPLWPQANGEVESFMTPLGKAIRAARTERRDWHNELPRFLLSYRTTPHTTTGVPPSQLLFNRIIRNTIPSYQSSESVDSCTVHRKARANDKKRKEKMKHYADNKCHAKTSELKLGDTVLVKQPKRNKFTTTFDPNPLTVVAVKGSMISAKEAKLGSLEMFHNFKKFEGTQNQ